MITRLWIEFGCLYIPKGHYIFVAIIYEVKMIMFCFYLNESPPLNTSLVENYVRNSAFLSPK